MATHVQTQSIQTPAGTLSKSKSYTGGAEVRLDGSDTIADGQTNKLVATAIDVSQVKSFWLNSTQDVTVKTNNSSTPDDTISLTANVPYVWNTDSQDAFLLTADVTKFYVTNASGSEAILTMECLYDSTP